MKITVMKTATAPPILALLLALSVASSTACDLAFVDLTEQHTDRWSRSYEIEPGGRFELRNVNGRITVEPAAGRTVEVVAERTARAASVEMAKQALDRVRMEEDVTARAVRIHTRSDRTGGFFNRTGHVSVRYTVRVPAGMNIDLDIATTNGGIDLTAAGPGSSARTKLSATNGGIKARDVAGPLEARTTNGGLEIDLAAVAEGGVRLGCTNGGIDVRLPADARASIDASVTNGGIRTGTLAIEISESSRRRLEGPLNGGGPSVELRCTNGGLDLAAR